MLPRHHLVKEGAISGFLGATVIAVWFFVVDVFTGHPLFTPQVLGRGLLRIFGMPQMADSPILHVAVYTLFHYAIFIIVGIVIVAIVHQGHRTPGILAGLLIVFVAFEVGVYGMTALFMETPLGGLAWYQVFLANLLAALTMGWWIWRKHPGVGADLRNALQGTDDHEAQYDPHLPEQRR